MIVDEGGRWTVADRLPGPLRRPGLDAGGGPGRGGGGADVRPRDITAEVFVPICFLILIIGPEFASIVRRVKRV